MAKLSSGLHAHIEAFRRQSTVTQPAILLFRWADRLTRLAARFVAVSLLRRIHIARWYRVDNRRVGLHRRCTDRNSGRPCDVRIERKPSARNQVELRWF